MDKWTHSQSQPTAEIGSDANTNRQLFFANNYGRLLDACLQSRQLLFPDAERLVEGLAGHLKECHAKTDEQFLEWACTILQPTVQRLSTFYDMKTRYNKFVLKGLWLGLCHTTQPDRFDDNAAVIPELESEVWLYVFEHLEEFMAPAKAKVSTRLYGLARLHAANWHKAQRIRYRAVSRRLAQGKGFLEVEVLPEPELSGMRAERGQLEGT